MLREPIAAGSDREGALVAAFTEAQRQIARRLGQLVGATILVAAAGTVPSERLAMLQAAERSGLQVIATRITESDLEESVLVAAIAAEEAGHSPFPA